MKTDNLNEKQVIIKELINSGINVTPSILEFLLNLDDPLKKVKLIIKNVSFLPNFDSHLTKEILQKVPNEEIHTALEKVLFKEIQSKTIQEKEFKEAPNIDLPSSSNLIEPEEIKPKALKISINDTPMKNELESQEKGIIINEFEKVPPQRPISNKIEPTPFEGSKSTLAFKPTAKDFEITYAILKDPTGKIYTNGEYKDFYDLTLDKFNKLKKLMRKRPEVLSANNINNILRLTNRVEVSVIGLVNEIRKTKNGNYFLTLEDLTNIINVIIKKDSENQENVKIAERTLNDQMVYVEGTYNPGERGKNGIIYCNYISKIDIPRDFEPNKSMDPLSIALISDTHIGSKEFEEKLWNRFIDFLNGKIGNKSQKEKAGRIKYIIINGDLVDGIGVYPAQKSDLIISDIYKQFEKATEILSGVPDHIKI
ncbi:MAG: OB-fold nucleic acid binding domain-containing protein, partial [Candidatus Hodarchaeota archaeon]